MDLQSVSRDPGAFQASIVVPTSSGNFRLGDVMADFQRERFNSMNPSLLAVVQQRKPPIPRFWDERTKGASKDSDAAVNLLWLLAFSKRSLRIQVGAYDGQQADEVRQIIWAILRIDSDLNRIVGKAVEVLGDKLVNRLTGSVCEILTSDKLGSHGSRPDVVLLDELTHQSDKTFASTLLDNLDKMANGLGIICTNAGHDPSWQLEWKRLFQQSERWQVFEYREPAPWIDMAAVRESELRNGPGRFRRLWFGEWLPELSSALDRQDVDECIKRLSPMSGREKGWIYYAGLDIGLAKHATGFVVVAKHLGWLETKEKPTQRRSAMHAAMIDIGLLEEEAPAELEYIEHAGTQRLRLAYHRSWKPTDGSRVSLEAVRSAVVEAHRRFSFAGVALDPWQGEHLAELLRNDRVPVLLVPQTAVSLQDQAVATIEAFQQRMIDLYPDEDLRADIMALRIKDSGTRVRLTSPERASGADTGTGHGDLASALSFAISLAKNRLPLSVFDDGRTLICS